MIDIDETDEKEISAADQAYNGIIDLVLRQELRPGERTSVNLLAASLSLGRTPIKEAITRLETEGLLSVVGRSGTMVNRIDREQTEHLFALRRVLEDFAAETAPKNISQKQIAKLRRFLQEMRGNSSANRVEAASFVKANVAFHALIVAAAGNPFLDRLYGQLQMQVQIVTYLVHRGPDPGATERRYREHEEIAKALISRDAKALKAALRSHSKATEIAILSSLQSDSTSRARGRNRAA